MNDVAPQGREWKARTGQQQLIEQQRWEVLEQLEDWMEIPMLVLGFIWLVLLVVEFVWGLNSFLETVLTGIWILFGFDFTLKFLLAPDKLVYLKTNWLTLVALLLPALRVFRLARVLRVLRLARTARGLRLVRILTSLNRGMRALAASMGRRGFGYVVVLTVIVALVGAAGMYAFEGDATGSNSLHDYGNALWWTAMLMTTLGSDYWPQTAEGRLLCFLLALYSFTVFGYLTATLASFFIGRDAENDEAEIAGAASLAALHAEIAALRADIQKLTATRET